MEFYLISYLKNTIYDQEEVREMLNNHVEVEENVGNSNDQFVKRIEDYKPTSKTCRSWVLRSGTNVGEALARYAEKAILKHVDKTIPRKTRNQDGWW